EALQTGRFEVFVPKTVTAMVRFNALMPRRVMEAVGRLMKGDQVLARPDHVTRAVYEARMLQTIGGGPVPEALEVAVAPEAAVAVEAAATPMAAAIPEAATAPEAAEAQVTPGPP